MKLLFENWRKFLNEDLLFEEFYYVSDKEFSQPLSSALVSTLANKLPGSAAARKDDPLKASGAEGIVMSLDDKRVIKLFHSLDNAAKNLPLVSKNMPETAQVYSTGKIRLDQPVIYFKKGSSYSPTDATPTKEIYYIVMQRVIPDPYIYRYVELGYESYNRLSNIDLNKLAALYNIEDMALKKRINEIFMDFINSMGEEAAVKFNNFEEFMQTATKKQKNITIQKFSVYRKKKTKEFVLASNGRPVLLKKLILNYLGLSTDLPYSANAYLQFLSNQPAFKRPPKKSFTDNTLAQDLELIIALVKRIIIDKKTPWNDIHREQFGRGSNNELVALDLGVKSDRDASGARAAFNKNVSQLATRGPQMKVVREMIENNQIKTLNVFDFDRTLFFTDDNIIGKRKYEKAFGVKYPHKGWFGKEESLSDELEIKENKQIRKIYDALKSEPDSLTIVISNRTFQLKNRIQQFLEDRGYFFDAILLKKGGVTKPERLQEFWDNHQQIDKINVFDDLDDSLRQYNKLKELYSIYREDLDFKIFKVMPESIIEV